MSNASVTVIGSGLAAWTTVRELRKQDAALGITLICADSGDFYAKPSLSNALAQGRTPAQLVTTPASTMAQNLGVELQAHTRVRAIAPAQRLGFCGGSLETEAGTQPYQQLVLATGAEPIRPPLVGDACDQVLCVNSLSDFAAFHARLRPGAQVALIGAGLIGCEFANDLAASGHPVAVIDPADRPLAALLPPQASQALQHALAGLGVQWHLGTTVRSVCHDAQTAGLALQLATGEMLGADVVLSAVGLRPDIRLAQAAGLHCERGIVADASLQTSAPHVYALGDAAQYASGWWSQGPVQGGRCLPYVMPLMAAAKTLAATLSGTPTPLQFGLMPVSIKTPAYPLVVAAAAPGTPGDWRPLEPDVWQFVSPEGDRVLGFALGGKQTPRRAEMSRLLEKE